MRELLSNFKEIKQKPVGSIFPGGSELAIDLIGKLLVFNPKNRMTLQQALQHKYVDMFRNLDDCMTHGIVLRQRKITDTAD